MPTLRIAPAIFRRSLSQSIALLLVSGHMAVAANALRPDPLPWIKSRAAVLAAIPADEQLTPQQAVSLAGQRDRVLFVDARSAEEFARQHIAGAVNVHYDPFGSDLDAAMAALPRDRTLVVYCGTEGCPLSEELAQTLKLAGHAQVKVLKDGIEGWVAAGGPVEATR